MLLSYTKRFTQLILGLFLYALGIYLQIQANIGLAPWDALNQGVSRLSGVGIGTISIVISFAVVLIDCLFREKIGFGTILNSILIGVFLDWLIAIGLVPVLHSAIPGVALQLLGLTCIGFASYFYISAGMGCGPRDGLMVALCKRFPHLPVGLVRGCLEGVVLLAGWTCGGTIGLGTVVAVFGLGFVVETVFRLFRFDVKALVHENVFDTLRMMGSGKK